MGNQFLTIMQLSVFYKSVFNNDNTFIFTINISIKLRTAKRDMIICV